VWCYLFRVRRCNLCVSADLYQLYSIWILRKSLYDQLSSQAVGLPGKKVRGMASCLTILVIFASKPNVQSVCCT
jgi:hypothetical protein